MVILIIAGLSGAVGYLVGKRSVAKELDECFRHYFQHFFEDYVGRPPGTAKTETKTGRRETTTETTR
jgi:hypothetical protein